MLVPEGPGDRPLVDPKQQGLREFGSLDPVVITTGCPGLMCSRSTTRTVMPRSAKPDLADASAAVPVHVGDVLRREAELSGWAGTAGDPG